MFHPAIVSTPECPGAYFTNDFSIVSQIQWKIKGIFFEFELRWKNISWTGALVVIGPLPKLAHTEWSIFFP